MGGAKTTLDWFQLLDADEARALFFLGPVGRAFFGKGSFRPPGRFFASSASHFFFARAKKK